MSEVKKGNAYLKWPARWVPRLRHQNQLLRSPYDSLHLERYQVSALLL